MEPVTLSLLDPVAMPEDADAGAAIAVALARTRLAEELGYRRVWFGEHHNNPFGAGPVPELMALYAADRTTRITVGTGAYLLGNSTPLRAAEAMSVLCWMHPGRTEMSFGRAPGTDGVTAHALRGGADNDFSRQLAELLAFTGHQGHEWPADHPYATVRPEPLPPTPVPMWLAGSSGDTAALAGELGLGYAFGHHITPDPDRAARAIRSYRETFKPSEAFPVPRAILTVLTVIGEDDATAERLSTGYQLGYTRLTQGLNSPFLSPETAAAHPWTDAERAVARQARAGMVVGGPETVVNRMRALLEATRPDELMVLLTAHSPEAQLWSLRELADSLRAAGLVTPVDAVAATR
ncbi:MsnO8 family LLM class oxidoreductase [Streptomyces sp. NPDC051016]|uniref:MsnO8 family LLM class oxidoreductase n=1 Tax=Streptomyces sp. NPDC051016 TaxID=3365638 RepID=UPI00379D3AA6